jgi:hypothetical protein
MKLDRKGIECRLRVWTGFICLGQGSVVCSYEILGSVKDGEFYTQLRNYQVVKKDFSAESGSSLNV